MMELVDMRDLGSRAYALGFESPCPHQKTTLTLIKRVKVVFLPIFKGFRVFFDITKPPRSISNGGFFVRISFQRRKMNPISKVFHTDFIIQILVCDIDI